MILFRHLFRNRSVPGALILLYHRVVELPPGPHSLHVTPQHFNEQMDILRKCAHPLPLAELRDALLEGRPLPPRSVAVTFDDGYADNLIHAKPLLERYEIPATFFITTGYLGGEREFWWDELEKLILHSEIPPGRYGFESSYWSFYHRLRPLAEHERERILSQLRNGANSKPAACPLHQVLSTEELTRLAKGGLVEIGAHSVTHPVLSNLSASTQREEIRQSKNRLEEILGFPVQSFAYPYGSPSDYTADTTALVREAGFHSACSAFDGFVRRDSDPFQLPRLPVLDLDGGKFSRILEKWLHH